MINEKEIEMFKKENNLIEIMGKDLNIKKKGELYCCKCPFHDSMTETMVIYPDIQEYNCLECGRKGNIVDYLVNIKQVPMHSLFNVGTAPQTIKPYLYSIYQAAAEHYHKKLYSPDGAKGLDYLKCRRLSDDIIRRFGLGYSNGKGLYEELVGKGYSIPLINASGLFLDNRYENKERFRDRVIFPIISADKKVIGFGGRVLDDSKPKYLNSAESIIFDKGANLYAFNLAKDTNRGYIILCEGNVDVISLYDAGYDNAVATLGTAITGEQAKLLKTVTDNVIISYDSDEAGINATLKAADILKKEGIQARTISLKPYKDPDEFIKNLGKEEFEKRISDSIPASEFKLDYLKEVSGDDKNKFVSGIIDELLKNPV